MFQHKLVAGFRVEPSHIPSSSHGERLRLENCIGRRSSNARGCALEPARLPAPDRAALSRITSRTPGRRVIAHGPAAHVLHEPAAAKRIHTDI
jgi:hypothetical protein